MSSGAATVHQDAAVYATLLEPGTEVTHRFPTGFGGYAFVVRGSARLPGTGESGDLDEGGAVKVVGEGEIMIQAGEHGAEALVVQTRVGHPEP